jgi:crossover junction endodeoxyribonuclease RuvC
MKICGLDLSLCNTGVAISVDASISWDVLSPPKGLRDVPRLDWITATVGELARGAELVTMEDFSYGSVGHQHEIGGMGFMVRHRLWKMGIPYVPVAPSRLKKFITGHGNAKKNEIMREVWRRWDHNAATDDCADAIGLCYLGLALTGCWRPTIAAQGEVLRDIWKAHGAVLEPWRGRIAADSLPLRDTVEKW